jgi:hypothetical protein
MSISSLFNTHEDAEAAAADLQAAGFPAGSVHTVTPHSGDVTARSLRARGISAVRAESTAEAVHEGRTLVIVETPLGTAKLAMAVLNRHHPNNSGISEVRYEGYVGDDTYWFSSLFRMPLLLKDQFPLSNWLGWPLLLKDNPNKTRSFGINFLSKNEFPLSSALGWKLLSDNEAPFSSLFGFKQLSKNEFPLSSLFGWRLLSKDEAQPN